MPEQEADDDGQDAVVEPPVAREAWEKPQLTRLNMDAAENGTDLAPPDAGAFAS